MNLIQENPYRIVGIAANSSEKEIQKQKSKLLRYASVGKQVTSAFDFPVFNKIERSESLIHAAFSKIEQNQEKIDYALFWFLNLNSFDETAISHLTNGDIEKAIEIWTKLTNDKEISISNFSCFNNLGTLKLCSNVSEEVSEGIEIKLKLIHSDAFKQFIHAVADQTYVLDNQTALKKFISYLLPELKKKYAVHEIAEFFKSQNRLTLDIIHQQFTEEPIRNIESLISQTADKRKTDAKDAYNFGTHLFENSKKDLKALKIILGEDHITYKMMAENLAKEVMQCGIDYFTEWKEIKNPSSEALTLLKHAQSIAINKQTKDRINENIKGVEEWVKTAPIQKELESITQKINNFKKQRITISNAKEFVLACSPTLEQIKDKIGVTNDFYLDISGAIVNLSLGAVIMVVNDEQEIFKFKTNQGLDSKKLGEIAIRRSEGTQASMQATLTHILINKDSAMSDLKKCIQEALQVSHLIERLDMSLEVQKHFDRNQDVLKTLATQLGVSSGSGNTGCMLTLFALASILLLLILG